MCVRPVEENISCCASDDLDTCTSKYCPLGHYCESVNAGDDKFKFCKSVKDIGEVCGSDIQCGYGAFCDPFPEEDEQRVCKPFGSLKNGDEIGKVDNPLYCESAQSVFILEVGTYNYFCT